MRMTELDHTEEAALYHTYLGPLVTSASRPFLQWSTKHRWVWL